MDDHRHNGRVQSFIESRGYLDQVRLKERLSCQLFLQTDESSLVRKKRAAKLDQLHLNRIRVGARPGSVWLIAPELSSDRDLALQAGRYLSSRGWTVHLVTRLSEVHVEALTSASLIIHHVKPLKPYSSEITSRGPVVCFSLLSSASLVLSGHKTICFLSGAEAGEALDCAYIPDFIVGSAAAGDRSVFQGGVDLLEQALFVKTPALPQAPHVPTVSACLIAKDEEGMIEGCLESLVPFADEVIVNDTGSVDRTAQLAEAYGAHVIRIPWRDDFASARNESLALAKCGYILTIDADERLCLGSVPDAKAGLLDGNEGWQCQIRNGDGARVRTSYAVRLFRNQLHHRYQGRIHEQIRPAIKGPVGKTPLALDHMGYTPGVSAVRNKRQRNLALLAQEAAEGSSLSAAYHKYQSAVEMLAGGDYATATDALKQVLDETRKDSSFRPNAGLHVLEGLIAQDRLAEAYSTAVRLVREYPGFLEAAELVAETLVEKDPQKAGDLLAAAARSTQGGDLPRSEGADTYRLDTLRARLALKAGEINEALSHLVIALKAKPDFAPAQVLLVTNWPDDAARVLSEMSTGAVRAAVLTCLSTANRKLAVDIASSAKDSGAAGEILLEDKDYSGAAEQFVASGEAWDSIRAAAIVGCGLAEKVTVPAQYSSLVSDILAGRTRDIAELDSVLRVLGFLLDIGATERFRIALRVLQDYGDEGQVLAARILSEKGRLEEAYRYLNGVSDTPAHLTAKADIAYRLGKYDDAACCYAALDAARPLTPNEYIRYIDSLIKCGLTQLAKEATVKSLGRYSDSYGLRRVAGILGIAKREE